MNYSKIKPLFSRILVRKFAPPKNVTKAGLILKADKNIRYGQIEEVGEGSYDDNGKLIKTTLQKGQWVLLPEYGGTSVPKNNNDEDDLVFYQETDILGVVEGIEAPNKKI